jgi:hypothetical protein
MTPRFFLANSGARIAAPMSCPETEEIKNSGSV